jgi:hypothetical protein
VNNKYLDKWGGPETSPQYSAAWANMSSTPFFGFKQLLYEGGTLAPFIVHWPKGIKAKGEIRTQYLHFNDIGPTILDLTGVKFLDTLDGVKQAPFEGVSFAYTFDNPTTPTKKKVQYYEQLGQRAIWNDGWKAVANHGGRMPWSSMLAASTPFDQDKWQLYNLNEDPSETDDLAAKFPAKLAELQKLWDQEAAKYGVFPLDDRIAERLRKSAIKISGNKTEYTYYFPGAYGIVESFAPQVKNRDHTIRTAIDLKGDEEGVIACMGGQGGGWSLFIKDHRVYYVYNSLGTKEFVLKSGLLPTGLVRIGVGYTKKENLQGDIGLVVNDKIVDRATVGPVAITFFSMDETFDIGRNTGTPVSSLYRDKGEFRFHGNLNKVVITLGGAAQEVMAPYKELEPE